MSSKLKLAMLVVDLILAAAAMVGCRSDTEYRLHQDSAESERIGDTTPGRDNRSYGGWYR